MTSIAETYCLIGLEPTIAQLACAKAILGERLSVDEAEVAFACTGRRDFPRRFQEAVGLSGRKGGKTEYVGTPILVHRAVTDQDASGTYLLCAPSKGDQARRGWEAINRYLAIGFPNLVDEVSESEMRIQLHNGNDLKIASANFRNLRGPKYKVVVVDEACFFVSDTPEDGGANPLGFILDSVVGGMVATEHPLLLLLSTPWTKAGIVYEQHRDRDLNLDRLIWQASTLQMFPGANQLLMARHRKDRGEDFYQREYMAQFSEDAIAYIEAADIDAAISEAPFFLAKPGMFYHMGLDPGRKRDHFGAAVAHSEAGSVVVDWCREWKPGVDGLKYAAILPEIWARAREYGVRKIASDQVDFGGIEASVPRDAYGTAEFTLERIMTGGQSGAELCDTTRALFAQRKLTLPNQPGLAEEFKRLADYLTVGGGRDVRAKRGADDRSRAIMLAVYQAFREPHLREPWAAALTPGRSDDGDERFWTKIN